MTKQTKALTHVDSLADLTPAVEDLHRTVARVDVHERAALVEGQADAVLGRGHGQAALAVAVGGVELGDGGPAYVDVGGHLHVLPVNFRTQW